MIQLLLRQQKQQQMNIYNLIGKLLDEIESKEQDSIWEEYLNDKNFPLDKIQKVLVVPYLEINGKIKLMSVLNRRFNEWGFICGTIERKETYIQAAKRELYEETKKMINIDMNKTNHYSFDIYEDSQLSHINNKRRYTVVLIDVSHHKHNIVNIENAFEKIKIKGREYNENRRLQLKTPTELFINKRVWPLMRKIVKRPEFQQIVG